jgi:hypothetical protein
MTSHASINMNKRTWFHGLGELTLVNFINKYLANVTDCIAYLILLFIRHYKRRID